MRRHRGDLAAAVCLLLPSLLAAGALPNVREIDGDEVTTLLKPDDIRAIDHPGFSKATAKFMRENEPVIGVFHNGVAKAYSLWHLDHHEIVNDTIGGAAISVTW